MACGLYINPLDLPGFIFKSPQPTVHFNVLKERNIDIRKIIINEFSPLFYAEEKRYPRFLLVAYENDIFGRLEQNKMVSKLFEA